MMHVTTASLVADNVKSGDVDLSFFVCVFDMKMRRRVFPPMHANNYSMESCQLRHFAEPFELRQWFCL